MVKKSEIEDTQGGVATKILQKSMKITEYSTIQNFPITECGWEM